MLVGYRSNISLSDYGCTLNNLVPKTVTIEVPGKIQPFLHCCIHWWHQDFKHGWAGAMGGVFLVDEGTASYCQTDDLFFTGAHINKYCTTCATFAVKLSNQCHHYASDSCFDLILIFS